MRGSYMKIPLIFTDNFSKIRNTNEANTPKSMSRKGSTAFSNPMGIASETVLKSWEEIRLFLSYGFWILVKLKT
jgi:hypothetical protein